MPLTVRVDGEAVGGQPNTIYASWFNDYHDLLTGTMQDQVVLLRTHVRVRAIGGPPGAATLAVIAGTSLGIGTYQYKITFLDADGGETIGGSVASATTTSGNQKIQLTAIPTGPSGTTERNIYRTKVGGSSYYRVATLADNTTTSYTDSIPDSSLVTAMPFHPNFGGLEILDYNGNVQTILYTDGSIQFDGGSINSDGSGSLYLNDNGKISRSLNTSSANQSYEEVTDSHSGADWDRIIDQSGNWLLWDNKNARNIMVGSLSNGTVNFPQGIEGPYGMIRNGTTTYVESYSGTATPSGDGITTPRTGAVWYKA